ncbi:hypothetical protein chiPu_0033215, partial [Chiloscyllium punctatum]|nr:hypothetical protein [Chiloscyllium punctatum]
MKLRLGAVIGLCVYMKLRLGAIIGAVYVYGAQAGSSNQGSVCVYGA